MKSLLHKDPYFQLEWSLMLTTSDLICGVASRREAAHGLVTRLQRFWASRGRKKDDLNLAVLASIREIRAILPPCLDTRWDGDTNVEELKRRIGALEKACESAYEHLLPQGTDAERVGAQQKARHKLASSEGY